MPKPRKQTQTVYEVYDGNGTVIAETTEPPVGVGFNVKSAPEAKTVLDKPKPVGDSTGGKAHRLVIGE